MHKALENIKNWINQSFLQYAQSAGKGLIWVIITFLFGLLQVFVIYAISKLNTDVTFSIGQVMRDGVFIFFSIALITSVTLDFLFEPKIDLNRMRGTVILFCLILPALVYMAGMLFYINSFITIIDNKEFYKSGIVLILITTFFHSLSSKSFLYHAK